MARVRDILDQALHLPLKQRARVAHELLTSLDERERQAISPRPISCHRMAVSLPSGSVEME